MELALTAAIAVMFFAIGAFIGFSDTQEDRKSAVMVSGVTAMAALATLAALLVV